MAEMPAGVAAVAVAAAGRLNSASNWRSSGCEWASEFDWSAHGKENFKRYPSDDQKMSTFVPTCWCWR